MGQLNRFIWLLLSSLLLLSRMISADAGHFINEKDPWFHFHAVVLIRSVDDVCMCGNVGALECVG